LGWLDWLSVLTIREEERDDGFPDELVRSAALLRLVVILAPAEDCREDDTLELLLEFRKELLVERLLDELLDGLLNVIRELLFLALLGWLIDDRFDVLLDDRLLTVLPDDRRDELLTALLERLLLLELRLIDPLELRELELFEELAELDPSDELPLLLALLLTFAGAPSRATNPKKNTAAITTPGKRLWCILRSMATSFLPGIARRSIRRLAQIRASGFIPVIKPLYYIDRPHTHRLA